MTFKVLIYSLTIQGKFGKILLLYGEIRVLTV